MNDIHHILLLLIKINFSLLPVSAKFQAIVLKYDIKNQFTMVLKTSENVLRTTLRGGGGGGGSP